MKITEIICYFGRRLCSGCWTCLDCPNCYLSSLCEGKGCGVVEYQGFYSRRVIPTALIPGFELLAA
jgi:hypothetical protein